MRTSRAAYLDNFRLFELSEDVYEDVYARSVPLIIIINIVAMSDPADDTKFNRKNIITALSDVITEWRWLGTQLDLPEHMLKIVGSSQEVEDRLRMMVSKWLDYDPEASWDKLANALNAMGKNTIAANIRSKYVGAVSSQTIPEDSPAPDQDDSKARKSTVLLT